MRIRYQRTVLSLAAVIALAAVCWADHVTGAAVSLLAFYIIPVAIAVFGVGLWAGISAALASACCVFFARAHADLFARHEGLLLWDSAMAGLTLVVTALGLRAMKGIVGDLIGEDVPDARRR